MQAQPTADEVKEEIIQPLADKVKAEAVPAAERLTREQLQPAAEQAAEQLDAGAQQLTEEVMKPAAEVSALKPAVHLLKCPLDRCSAVHVSLCCRTYETQCYVQLIPHTVTGVSSLQHQTRPLSVAAVSTLTL